MILLYFSSLQGGGALIKLTWHRYQRLRFLQHFFFFFPVTFISDGGKPAVCDFIFSGLIEELGVHVTTEGDHKMLIFIETSEASAAFPLTQNSKTDEEKKKKEDQHRPQFVKIWKQSGLRSVPPPRSRLLQNYGCAAMVTIRQGTRGVAVHLPCSALYQNHTLEYWDDRRWNRRFYILVTEFRSTLLFTSQMQFKQARLISLHKKQSPYKHQFKKWMCQICLLSITHSENTKGKLFLQGPSAQSLICLMGWCEKEPISWHFASLHKTQIKGE